MPETLQLHRATQGLSHLLKRSSASLLLLLLQTVLVLMQQQPGACPKHCFLEAVRGQQRGPEEEQEHEQEQGQEREQEQGQEQEQGRRLLLNCLRQILISLETLNLRCLLLLLAMTVMATRMKQLSIAMAAHSTLRLCLWQIKAGRQRHPPSLSPPYAPPPRQMPLSTATFSS